MHDRRFPGSPQSLRTPGRRALLEVDRVVDLCLGAFDARSVIDVGTGSGLFAEAFAARGLTVAGIDVNPAMVEAARHRVHGGHFRHAPAEAIPFDVDAFDLAFLGCVLHETDDPLMALREARRVAQLGAAVLEWPYAHEEVGPPLAHRMQPERITHIAIAAGFATAEPVKLAHMVLYRLPASTRLSPDAAASTGKE